MVNWGSPEHTNGDLTSYEVCLSEDELGEEEDCDMFSLFTVPPDMLTFERFQLIQTRQLAVQVLRELMLLLHEDIGIAERVTHYV